MPSITDPHQRLEYLKNFRSACSHSCSPAAWGSWCERIRSDLGVIANPEVRDKATELFRPVESCSYIQSRTPDLYPKFFQETTDALIAYLASNDR